MKWNSIQRDFSGGEISPRLWMRDDSELYYNTVRVMRNFYPTLQGSADRVPGTRYIGPVTGNVGDVRLFPFLTPSNDRAVVELTPGAAKVYSNITSTGLGGSPLDPTTRLVDQVPNGTFEKGENSWVSGAFQPDMSYDTPLTRYISETTSVRTTLRLLNLADSVDYTKTHFWNFFTLTEDTSVFHVFPLWRYVGFIGRVFDEFRPIPNPPPLDYLVTMTVYDDSDDSVVWQEILDSTVDTWFGSGQTYSARNPVVQGPFLAGSTYKVEVKFELPNVSDPVYSGALFDFFGFRVFAEQIFTPRDDGTVSGVNPYTADELLDVQYVQSPYPQSGAAGKELVFTQPNRPPQELVADPAYDPLNPIIPPWIMRDKPFTGQPAAWTDIGYPAVCTSFNGRLILAGSYYYSLDYVSAGVPSETVWGTDVGDWGTFTTASTDPADAVEFTAIYRSPIQWAFGQKQLAIGALEMEYIAGSDNLFAPGDISVQLHSSHGSKNVQPVGFGQTILFPAESGYSVRSMKYQDEEGGWIAEDMTLLNPELLGNAGGVKRMVRLRNPHQMMVALLENGKLAVLHMDTYAEIYGWSRIEFSGDIQDICVQADDDGNDILFMAIRRVIAGQEQFFIEAVVDWRDGAQWQFLESSVLFTSVTSGGESTITGLDHLNDSLVQVVGYVVGSNSGSVDYIGEFVVRNNQVELKTEAGVEIKVTSAVVGLPMDAELETNPLVGRHPGRQKRYQQVYVRLLGSSRPIINGTRTPDRSPETPMGQSEPLVAYDDIQVSDFGHSPAPTVQIRETRPVRCEVVGIYGAIKEGTV